MPETHVLSTPTHRLLDFPKLNFPEFQLKPEPAPYSASEFQTPCLISTVPSSPAPAAFCFWILCSKSDLSYP